MDIWIDWLKKIFWCFIIYLVDCFFFLQNQLALAGRSEKSTLYIYSSVHRPLRYKI